MVTILGKQNSNGKPVTANKRERIRLKGLLNNLNNQTIKNNKARVIRPKESR